MAGEGVGCFRIFEPESAPDVLELGSVVSIQPWVGTKIASYAEKISTERSMQIIAITGERYAATLENRWWQLATDSFRNRMAESHLDKKLWIYPKL
jgi:hypothetical protein